MVGETLVGHGAGEQLPAAPWRTGPKTAQDNFSQSCQKIEGGTKGTHCSLWGPKWDTKTPFLLRWWGSMWTAAQKGISVLGVLKVASVKPLLMQCWQQPCSNGKVRLDDLQSTLPLSASRTLKSCRYSTLRKARTAGRNPSQRLRTYTPFLSLSLCLLCQILACISEREPIMSDRVTAVAASLLQTLSRSSQVSVWIVIRTFI